MGDGRWEMGEMAMGAGELLRECEKQTIGSTVVDKR
jgi:hypothetical protein